MALMCKVELLHTVVASWLGHKDNGVLLAMTDKVSVALGSPDGLTQNEVDETAFHEALSAP